MKNLFYKWLLVLGLGISLSSVSMSSQAYHCEWQNGHKVCWHNGERPCYWVKGHWHKGHYYRRHKVCRYYR